MVSILDCTLRDGGYVNDFAFGERTIKSIIEKLGKASIDIIECGFLQDGADDKDKSLFCNATAIKKAIKEKKPNSMYVGMIVLGKLTLDNLEDYDGTSIDGIRLTFHEHEIDDAMVAGRTLMSKGYKVFMQPVGTTTYTDEALIGLINLINDMKPYAFYMVDTLGTMYKKDLLHMFSLVDGNLDEDIVIGFHSHNNLQMSFANCQELLSIETDRNLIVDASVLGMGRGAGNLNTELVTQYINVNFGLKYDNFEILQIMDDYIKPLSREFKWGYDAAYYLAAISGCHPNYAAYLMNMQTLQITDINSILSGMDEDKRALFDKDYISKEYLKYMDHNLDDSLVRSSIKAAIGDKEVMILAPGKSLRANTEMINEQIKANDYYVVSVNFCPTDIPVDMVFISNLKRFKNLGDLEEIQKKGSRIILTSNIEAAGIDNIDRINYSSYLNEELCILDNAGLMSMNLLKKLGVKNITLAGFDGFSKTQRENYYADALNMTVEEERALAMNEATSKKIAQLKTQLNISFISNTIYQ